MPVGAVDMRAYEAETVAARLESCANVGVKGVINFLNTWSQTLTHIQKEILAVFKEYVMSKKLVSFWCRAFQNGQTGLTDEPQAEKWHLAWEGIIHEERYVKMCKIEAQYNI